MPHLKCTPCGIRLQGVPGLHDGVGELCPGCGAPLDKVRHLTDIVGFQPIGPPGSGPPGWHDRVVDCVGGTPAGRKGVIGQARVERERWLDDGESYLGPGSARPARPAQGRFEL